MALGSTQGKALLSLPVLFHCAASTNYVSRRVYGKAGKICERDDDSTASSGNVPNKRSDLAAKSEKILHLETDRGEIDAAYTNIFSWQLVI